MREGVRYIYTLETEFLEGDEAVNGPRGWGEASVGTVRVTRIDPDTYELKIPGLTETFRVNRESVRKVLNMRVSE